MAVRFGLAGPTGHSIWVYSQVGVSLCMNSRQVSSLVTAQGRDSIGIFCTEMSSLFWL